MILYSFTDVNLTFIANGNYCESHIKNTKLLHLIACVAIILNLRNL